MNTILEDLYFAIDICLLLTNRTNMQNKTSIQHETALSVGLKRNTQKKKIISLNDKNIKQLITLKGNNIDEVENFTYLGTNIIPDNRTSKDIMARINKPERLPVICNLRTIWKTTSISRSTNIKIYNSNVKSVFL